MPEDSPVIVAACWPSGSTGFGSCAAAFGSGVAADGAGAATTGVLPALFLGSGLARDSSADLSGVTMMSFLPTPPSLCSAPTNASAQLCPRRRQEQVESTLLRYF